MPNPIKPTIKTEIAPVILIILTVGVSVFFYNNLPEKIAVHWNFAGQADRYSSGQNQAIIAPLVIIGAYLLFLFIPYLDPRKDAYKQFNKVYHIFKSAILALLFAVYLVIGLNGLGYNLPVEIIVPGLIGILFIVMGKYMGEIKMNWFMGIRTPWTLSSEEVWDKTHRFSGKMFVLAGLLMVAQIFLPLKFRLPVFIISIAAIVFGAVIYSYILYLKQTRQLAEKNKSGK